MKAAKCGFPEAEPASPLGEPSVKTADVLVGEAVGVLN